MTLPRSVVRHSIVTMLAAGAIGLMFSPSVSLAQAKLEIKPVAERKLKELPAGSLYWRLETFATLAEAQAAAGPTSLAAEVAGKVWLFTLGAKGGATRGDSKVAETGPGPPIPRQETRR